MGTRSQGSEPSLRKGDGRWHSRYYDNEGRRRSVYGKTKAECKRKLRQALEDRDAGIVSPNMRVGTWLDSWSASLRGSQLTLSTVERHEYDLLMVPAWFRALRLREVKPSTVNKLITEWLTVPSERTKKPRATSSVARARLTLKKAFQQAVADDLLVKNPVALSRTVSVTDEREPDPLTFEEARLLLDRIAGHRMESLYVTVITLGLRLSETLNLRWRDIDLDARELRVKTQSPRTPKGKVVERDPKTKAGKRTIGLPDHVVTALRARRIAAMEECLAAGRAFDGSEFVWPTRKGDRMMHRVVLRQLERFCEKAGIRRRRFHDLRHSAGTLLLAMGLGERVIMEILGHADPRMIARYQQVTPKVRHDAAAQIDQAWGDAMGAE